MNDWWIVRLAVMPDHIHMLIELPPTVTVANAVKTFKGGSSRALIDSTGKSVDEVIKALEFIS